MENEEDIRPDGRENAGADSQPGTMGSQPGTADSRPGGADSFIPGNPGMAARELPYSIEAEQSVIGSMLLNPAAIETASEILSPEDFYQRQYGIIYQAICELYNGGIAVDMVSLQEHLKGKDLPPEACSLEFFRELVNMVPTSANIKYYAQIVYDKSLLRRLIEACKEIEQDCYAQEQEIPEICGTAEKKIFTILDQRKTQEFEPISITVSKVIDKIAKASLQKSSVTGVPTGFTDLDRQTSGMQPSDLILVAARPSMGKTAFILNMARNMILHGYRIAIFSLEMSKEQLVNRLLSMESNVDSQVLRNGNLTDSDWDNVVEASSEISEWPLVIDDTPGITVSELRTRCRRYKLEHGLDCIMIDYLQLMSGSGARNEESRQQEISSISRSLKALARELNVPVIACSQLSRAPELRTDHRPMLSDLRESGAIEQDADVVMFLYRDEYYNKESPNKGITEVMVAKQRNGPVGTIELVWLANLTRYANKSYDTDLPDVVR